MQQNILNGCFCDFKGGRMSHNVFYLIIKMIIKNNDNKKMIIKKNPKPDGRNTTLE